MVGLQGQTNNTAIVIEHLEDAKQLDFSRPIYLFSQTTKSVDEFHQLVETIRSQMAEGVLFEWHDTICRNVANRVEKLRQFAQENDIVIFVGGKKSSNAKVLFFHCQEVNPRTVFVSSDAELTDDILSACHAVERVGICGATSTPLWLMQKVAEAVSNGQGIENPKQHNSNGIQD